MAHVNSEQYDGDALEAVLDLISESDYGFVLPAPVYPRERPPLLRPDRPRRRGLPITIPPRLANGPRQTEWGEIATILDGLMDETDFESENESEATVFNDNYKNNYQEEPLNSGSISDDYLKDVEIDSAIEYRNQKYPVKHTGVRYVHNGVDSNTKSDNENTAKGTSNYRNEREGEGKAKGTNAQILEHSSCHNRANCTDMMFNIERANEEAGLNTSQMVQEDATIPKAELILEYLKKVGTCPMRNISSSSKYTSANSSLNGGDIHTRPNSSNLCTKDVTSSQGSLREYLVDSTCFDILSPSNEPLESPVQYSDNPYIRKPDNIRDIDIGNTPTGNTSTERVSISADPVGSLVKNSSRGTIPAATHSIQTVRRNSSGKTSISSTTTIRGATIKNTHSRNISTTRAPTSADSVESFVKNSPQETIPAATSSIRTPRRNSSAQAMISGDTTYHNSGDISQSPIDSWGPVNNPLQTQEDCHGHEPDKPTVSHSYNNSPNPTNPSPHLGYITTMNLPCTRIPFDRRTTPVATSLITSTSSDEPVIVSTVNARSYYHPMFNAWLSFPTEVPDEDEAKLPGMRKRIADGLERLAVNVIRLKRRAIRKGAIKGPLSE
jgi:hypothetical protein